jgi:DNA-binding transcriptional LysR family regulator
MTDLTSAPRMRLDELAVFLEVAAAGSIAAASRRLGVPKSTIGRAISRLERDFGTTLVRRMARGPALTGAGRLLADRAAPHISALRDLGSATGQDALEAYGTLRVTAPSDIGTLVLAPLVTSFATLHPRVRVEVELTTRVVDLVREGFDLAVRIAKQRTLPSSALVARRLARLELGLYAATSYLARAGTPKRPGDLGDHEHVLFSGREGRAVLALESARSVHKLTVTGRTSVNEFLFVREAVAAGGGIGALPGFVAAAEVAAGRVRRVLPDYRIAGNFAYLVYPPSQAGSAKLTAFRSFLLERAPTLLEQA